MDPGFRKTLVVLSLPLLGITLLYRDVSDRQTKYVIYFSGTSFENFDTLKNHYSQSLICFL